MLLKYWHEANQAALMPARAMAQATAAFWGAKENPLSRTPGARMLVASADVFQRLTDIYPKPEWNIKAVEIDGHSVPIRQEIADETPFYRLIRFTRDPAAVEGASAKATSELGKKLGGQPRGVLIAPISGHHATLLRGTASEMLKSGDLYVTEWKCASTVPLIAGEFGISENAAHIKRALEVAGPGCHLTAVCQPCPATLSVVAFMSEDNHPCKPRSLTLMAGPIDTRINPQECNRFATENPLWKFDMTMLHLVPPSHAGFGRVVMPGLIQQAGFVGQNFGKHFKAHNDYFWALVDGAEEAIGKHRKFYNEYNALLDMHGKYYRETISSFFQNHLLPKGELVLGGRRVNLKSITDVPLLIIEGGQDDICGVGQTAAAFELCNVPKSMREHWIEPDAGHYGVFSGGDWRASIAPRVAAFQAKWDHPSL